MFSISFIGTGPKDRRKEFIDILAAKSNQNNQPETPTGRAVQKLTSNANWINRLFWAYQNPLQENAVERGQVTSLII